MATRKRDKAHGRVLTHEEAESVRVELDLDNPIEGATISADMATGAEATIIDDAHDAIDWSSVVVVKVSAVSLNETLVEPHGGPSQKWAASVWAIAEIAKAPSVKRVFISGEREAVRVTIAHARELLSDDVVIVRA